MAVPNGKSRTLMKSMLIYMIGNVLGKLTTSFFLTPLQSGTLGPDAFGYVDMILVISNVIIPVVFLHVWDGILRFSFDRDSDDHRKTVFTNGFLMFICSTALTLVLGLITGTVWKTTGLKNNYLELKDLHFLVLIVILQGGVNVLQYYCRAMGKNTVFAVSGLVFASFIVIFNYLFLGSLHMGIQGVLTANGIALAVECLFLIAVLKVPAAFRPKKISANMIKKMALFAAPLAVNAVFYWVLTAVNRFFLNDRGDNGNYAAALRLSNALQIFTTVVSLAWQESAFASHKDADRSDYYSQGFNLYCRVMGCGLLCLLPVIHIMFPFLVRGAGFAQSRTVIPIFLFFTVLSALSMFLGTLYAAEKRTTAIIWTTLAALAVDLAVLLPLLKPLGLMAAPIATSAGFLVMVLMRVLLLRPAIRIKIDVWFIGLFVVMAVFMGFFYYTCGVQLNIIALFAAGGVSLYMLRDLFFMILPGRRGKHFR